MDYTVLLSITAIVLSGLSLLFVVLKEHIGLGLEFRESETTSRRKKEILVALNKEIEQEIVSFVATCNEKKIVDEIIKNSIDDLSIKHNNVSLGNELLESATYFFNRFLRNVIVTVFAIVLTIIFLYIEYPLTSQAIAAYLLFVVVLVIFVYIFAHAAYQNVSWYETVRDSFLKLSEDPTLKNAKKIAEELNKKEIPNIATRET